MEKNLYNTFRNNFVELSRPQEEGKSHLYRINQNQELTQLGRIESQLMSKTDIIGRRLTRENSAWNKKELLLAVVMKHGYCVLFWKQLLLEEYVPIRKHVK